MSYNLTLTPQIYVCTPFVAGLLRKQEGGRSAFAGVKKALRLLVDDVNDMAPTDIAYTFSGYAPLGIRLIEVRSPLDNSTKMRQRARLNTSSRAKKGEASV